MGTVIVVTTHPLSDADAAALVKTAGGDASAANFHVAVPEQPTSGSMDAVMSDWELGVTAGRGVGSRTIAEGETNPGAVARHDAEAVLAASLKTLQGVGASADGPVTPNHPLDSIGDLVAHHSPDEVVVMVRHHHLNEVTHTDLAAKIGRAFKIDTVRIKSH